MDPEQVKKVAFMLTSGAGILALVTTLPALLGGRRRAPGAVGAGFLTMVGGLLILGIAGVVGLRLEPATGHRGAALMFGLGALLAPLATLIGALCSDESDAGEASPPAAWSLIPGVVLSGLGLAEVGWLAQQYGVNAQMQGQFWTAGVALGLSWSVLALRATRAWPGAEALCGNITGAGVIAITVGWTLQLADYHFGAPSTTPWFVLFCGVGLIAGWTVSLAAAAFTDAGRGSRGATIVSAAVMTVAVSLVAGSAQINLVKDVTSASLPGLGAPLLPAMAAGFLAALLLLGLVTGTDERAPDSIAGSASVMLLVGIAWVGFKLMLGLGIAVCALGFLAAWPCATALGVAAPSRHGMPVPQRFTTLAGATLALLAAFKIYQEAAELALTGIDVADGNVLLSLVAGLGLPVLLESAFGRRPVVADSTRRGAVLATAEAFARLVGVAALALVAVICVALFAGPEGVAVLILGMALWGVVAAASMAANGEEAGLPTWRSLPAALLTASVALIALPWKGVLLDITREQKMQVVLVLAAASTFAVIGGAIASRRRPAPPAEGPAPPSAEPNGPITSGGDE